MDQIVQELIEQAQSSNENIYHPALSDLRYIIERHIMNRYSEKESSDYFLLFYAKGLVNYKLEQKYFHFIKYFLFFALFNFPDRGFMIAQCIKVLFDTDSREAICAGLEKYMNNDDLTSMELILAITDVGDSENYCSNTKIIDMLRKISEHGLHHSKETAFAQLSICSNYSSIEG